MTREYHLHLISDATGETLNTVAKAVAAQFEGISPREHIYSLVRTERQLYRAVEHIAADPGVVFFTLVNPSLRSILEAECKSLNVPCVSILDRAVEVLGKHLGAKESHRPGGQHDMDSRYLERVEALNFAIQHDDGQNAQNLAQADVVLVGVSRSSKTPTCVYLAIRGVKAANIPVVPGKHRARAGHRLVDRRELALPYRFIPDQPIPARKGVEDRSLAVLEPNVLSQSMRNHQYVGEQDRRIEIEAPDRLEGHLDSQIRRHAHGPE